jgi:hypothetical protein
MGLTTDDDGCDREDDRRRGNDDEYVQMPIRCASSSRWYVGSPKRSSDDFARLVMRRVLPREPMPPWISDVLAAGEVSLSNTPSRARRLTAALVHLGSTPAREYGGLRHR